jgi:hypothetical protein
MNVAELVSNAMRLVICQVRQAKPAAGVTLTPRLASDLGGKARWGSLGPSSIPSLGDGVMLGTAWIDRPVDTQGRAPCFHVLLSARMEARPCSSQ